MARQPPAEPTIELLSQTTALRADDTLTIRVRPDGLDVGSLSVDVIVFAALEPGAGSTAPSGPPLAEWSPGSFAALFVEATGDVTIRVPIGGGAGRLPLPDPGVYPLSVQVTGSGGTAELDTTVIRLPDASLPSQTPVPVSVIAEAGAGRLAIEELTELVTRVPAAPLTVVLDDQALDRLRTATTAATLAAALDRRPVIVGTDPPLDPSALASVGLGEVYRAAVGDAMARVEALGLVVDRSAIVIDEPLTPEGAELLSELGLATVLLTKQVSSPAGRWPPTTGTLTVAGGELLVVNATRAEPVDVLDGAGSPAQRAQEMLARLALSNPARDHGVVLAGIGGIAQPVATIETVLLALTETPTFRLLPLAPDLGRSANLPSVAPAVGTGQNLTAMTDQLDRLDARLATYSSFHLDGARSPDDFRTQLGAAFDTRLDVEGRTDALDRIERDLDAALQVISLPGNQSVTLAARSAPLPLAVDNAAAGARRVSVQLRSDEITLLDPAEIITIPTGSNVVELDVETRSLGASPVTVTLLTPDGSTVLATTRFRVRSTAIPGLGLLLSATLLGLLGTWWFVSIRRNRSSHPSRASLQRAGGSTAFDDEPAGDGDGDVAGSEDRDPVAAGDSV